MNIFCFPVDEHFTKFFWFLADKHFLGLPSRWKCLWCSSLAPISCFHGWKLFCFSADTSDEILAKYRSKPAPVPKPSDSSTTSSLPSSAGGTSRPVEEEEGPPAYDPNNLETCKAFLDAKKKLRLVLSNADFQVSLRLCACWWFFV